MYHKEYENCTLCPRKCRINRFEKHGICLAGKDAVINKIMLHPWEEPIICHGNGTGAVFFSGCQLKCVFCQNSDISQKIVGQVCSDDEMCDIFLELQNEKGACNINLITATPFIPSVRSSLIKAKKKGLFLPVVFNSGGYEDVETLKTLDGLIDVYLPDIKYYSTDISANYSKCPDYFEKAIPALEEMIRQVGKPRFGGEKLKSGVIVRHLILPSHKNDSIEILSQLKEKFGNDSFVLSVMSQFVPNGSNSFPELNRKITSLEYRKVIDFAFDSGFEYILTQQKESASKEFIPEFNK